MISKIQLMSLMILMILCLGIDANASVQIYKSNKEIPESTPTGTFTDHGNGTVTDKRTGLMWAKCAEGLSTLDCTGSPGSYNWQQAMDTAQSNTLAGYDDWRLPNLDELMSIVEKQCKSPAINGAVFPNTPSAAFWSASPLGNGVDGAWYVYFNYGVVRGCDPDYPMFVRLVRSGQ